MLYDGCKKTKNRKTKNDVLYFSSCGAHSGILCYIFPHVERALVLLCFMFRILNALWHYCVIISACGTRSGLIVLQFSACGTRSGIIVLYFTRVERALSLLCYVYPRMEHALALLCYSFRTWNALWYFVFNSFFFVIY